MKKQEIRTIKQRGSATVEAVVSFTGFLFVIFTILGVVKYCRAQALISNAVDAAAKELSQYSYFYEMSGLNKFSDSLGSNAKIGKDNMNNVVGTLGSFYDSVSSSVSNASSNVGNLYQTVGAGDLEGAMDQTQYALSQTQLDMQNISTSGESIYNAFSNVKNNPLVYIRSFVAIAVNSCSDELKSYLIAAPLGKVLMEKHFTMEGRSADEELKSLGVVDGLSGMNFKLSTIFHSNSPHRIHLVVYYKLKLFQIFDWATLEVPICKEAMCDAWLGGDAVAVRLAQDPAPAGDGNTPATSEDPQDTPAPTEDPAPAGDGNTPETSEDPQDTPAPTEDPEEHVDTDGSYWYLPEVGEDGYDEKIAAFIQMLIDQYDLDTVFATKFLEGIDKDGHAYGFHYCVDASDDNVDLIAYDAYYQSICAIKSAMEYYIETNGEHGIAPGTVKDYTMVVYVPENISDEALEALMAKAREEAEVWRTMAREECGLNIPVSIVYQKGGGNYDYENGGGN